MFGIEVSKRLRPESTGISVYQSFGLESRDNLLYGSGFSRRTESRMLPHLAIITQHV